MQKHPDLSLLPPEKKEKKEKNSPCVGGGLTVVACHRPSPWMASYLTPILQRYANKYIIDLPDLQLSLWSGDIVLHNLTIRVSGMPPLPTKQNPKLCLHINNNNQNGSIGRRTKRASSAADQWISSRTASSYPLECSYFRACRGRPENTTTTTHHYSLCTSVIFPFACSIDASV